jgi:hypothetical protein
MVRLAAEAFVFGYPLVHFPPGFHRPDVAARRHRRP